MDEFTEVVTDFRAIYVNFTNVCDVTDFENSYLTNDITDF